ncbi:metalloregulator ArsR/SmtB family transcription factor [Cocleimonas flava]|uniref:ArsR family transcriptional regulator n=1 Tax=Cocleimonas flava TaxID=634765 RepID=A0A4R1F4E6_9GAMM|nr:metalloregulator ArsR/SmtB family transcription factor [Cocleimonas flava]TCJ88703.1 ArsR family transcriptional regulator [Cocleimonas flava]
MMTSQITSQITPEEFTKALSDPTRLRVLMLLIEEDELCVCQLTEALNMVQPKISRHLAVLREKKILLDNRKGLWIFYRLHPEMPTWCHQTLLALSSGCFDNEPYKADLAKIKKTLLPDGASVCI